MGFGISVRGQRAKSDTHKKNVKTTYQIPECKQRGLGRLGLWQLEVEVAGRRGEPSVTLLLLVNARRDVEGNDRGR